MALPDLEANILNLLGNPQEMEILRQRHADLLAVPLPAPALSFQPEQVTISAHAIKSVIFGTENFFKADPKAPTGLLI